MSFTRASILLAVALGTQERCREDIEKAYNANKQFYYSTIVKSGLAKSHVYDKFTVTTSEYIKMCFGLIAGEHLSGKELLITKLIKKVFKPAYTYYTHNKHVTIEEFTMWYTEREGGFENVSGIYLDYSFYVLYYLSESGEEKLLPSPMMQVIEEQYATLFANDRVEDIEKDSIYDEDGLLKADFKGYPEFIEKITHKGKIGDDVSLIFENLRLKEEVTLLEQGVSLSSFNGELSRMPFTKITNVLHIMSNVLGIDPSVTREAKISDTTIKSIAKYLHVNKNANGLSDRDVEVLFLTSLSLYAIIKEYNNLKKVHYEKAKSNLVSQELEYEKEKSELESNFRLELSKLSNRLNTSIEKSKLLKSESDSKDKTIKDLELKLKRAEQQVEKLQQNNKEVDFLREYFLENSNPDEEVEDSGLTIEELQASLSTIKGVIIGGHTNLRNKLKEVLPSFTIVAPESLSRDMAFVRNRDIVFIISVNNNHSMYGKIMSEVGTSNTEVTYLSRAQNIDILCNEMYNKSKKFGIL